MDSSLTITKVHPSLNELSGLSKNISDSILTKLSSCVESLEAEKKNRLEKVVFVHLLQNVYIPKDRNLDIHKYSFSDYMI